MQWKSCLLHWRGPKPGRGGRCPPARVVSAVAVNAGPPWEHRTRNHMLWAQWVCAHFFFLNANLSFKFNSLLWNIKEFWVV